MQSNRQASASKTLKDAVKRYSYITVEMLALLIRLEEGNFINFQTRLAEFRTQPQLRTGKQVITINPDKSKRQKKD